jgi:uncharacterized protein (DUF58 family)
MGTSLLPYETVTYAYRLHPPRGVHMLGPAALRSGDLFGMRESRAEIERTDRLVVYPRAEDLPRTVYDARVPLAGRPLCGAIASDPSAPVGVRPLSAAHSRRLVHWKATARLGRLMAIIPEQVADTTLVLVVNAATFEAAHIGVDPELQERVIAVAAGVGERALARGIAVGLAVNSAGARGGPLRVAPGSGRHQRRALLEALAGVTPFVTRPVERLVGGALRSAPPGAALAVVTAVVTPQLVGALSRAAHSGRAVTLVRLDTHGPAVPRGIREIAL